MGHGKGRAEKIPRFLAEVTGWMVMSLTETGKNGNGFGGEIQNFALAVSSPRCVSGVPGRVQRFVKLDAAALLLKILQTLPVDPSQAPLPGTPAVARWVPDCPQPSPPPSPSFTSARWHFHGPPSRPLHMPLALLAMPFVPSSFQNSPRRGRGSCPVAL